jgi:ATP-dependent RNA helicase DeaD
MSEDDPVPDSEMGGMDLSEAVYHAIEDLGYTAPTPIQEQTIPPMLEGHDLVGQAQTGTGKTAAFGIPLAETLDPRERHVQSIVLTPTRELAVQVSEELQSLCKYRRLRVLPIYGGPSINRQIDALQKGAHIVVGTPGRILDHLGRGTLRLDWVRTAVLDEADEMLDIGFADDIERILGFTPQSRQTVLFSATMPKAIHNMVNRHLKHPTWVKIGGEAQPLEQVKQVYFEVATRDKNAGLEELLRSRHAANKEQGNAGQTLIFRRTKRGVERLVDYLYRRKYSVSGIHGGLSQGQRNTVMNDFRAGRLELMVATNLAARGLDIPAISRVINFDPPQNVEEYVHRIGRTGRMGRSGTAITFVGEWELDDFDPIRRHVGNDLELGRLKLYS